MVFKSHVIGKGEFYSCLLKSYVSCKGEFIQLWCLNHMSLVRASFIVVC